MGGLTFESAALKQYPARYERRAVVGVDLGKMNDHTAICVIEKETTGTGKWEFRKYNQQHEITHTDYRVRAIRRLPIGMDYTEQIQHIAGVLRRVTDMVENTDLVLDATGVGTPIADLFDRAGLRPIRCVITAGDSETRTRERDYRVSKLTLISGIEAATHSGDIRIAAAVAEGEALREKLREFQRHVTAAGNSRFEGRIGRHDDLVLAAAIANWWLRRKRGHAERTRVIGL